MERAVIYCRTNSSSGVSIPNQEKACRRFAEENDYAVDGVFSDKGEVANATALKSLQQMLGYVVVAKNRPSVLLVTEITRLGRSEDDIARVTEHFKGLGIKVASAHKGERNDNSASEKLKRNLIALFAQFDEDVRREHRLRKRNAD